MIVHLALLAITNQPHLIYNYTYFKMVTSYLRVSLCQLNCIMSSSSLTW